MYKATFISARSPLDPARDWPVDVVLLPRPLVFMSRSCYMFFTVAMGPSREALVM